MPASHQDATRLYDSAEQAIALDGLASRHSLDTTTSSDLDHLLSDDGDEDASSISSSSSPQNGPPVDGGRQAWTFLLGCWLIEAMIWGFALSFGVFQRYYSAHPFFKENSARIPLIGTLATGVSYLGMPFTNAFCLRLGPRGRRIMCAVGWGMCVLGLLGASFATEVWALVVWQGLVYGCGWVVCYTPFLFMLNDWFVARRGLAYGILFGASGVSGMVIPLVLGWMLDGFGFRTALRVFAIAILLVSGPGLLLVRPRKPGTECLERDRMRREGGVRRLLRRASDRDFLLMAAAVFTQGLGFFVPNIYIASYAEDLGLSRTTGSALLAIVSLSQVAGQTWQGWISDRVNIYLPVSISGLAPGLGALFLWGPAKGFWSLVAFSALWGFFSASYSVLYTRMCTYLTAEKGRQGADDEAAMLIYGLFSFERGISNILEGPVSSSLMDDGAPVIANSFGLGRYAAVVWYTVVCMLVSSMVGVGWVWRPK